MKETIPLTPAKLGLPHDEYNPHQRETIQAVLDAEEKFILVQAPTGTGKTLIPVVLNKMDQRVMALVEKKFLQTENYGAYNFDILMGLRNYTCALDPALRADACQFKKQGMKHCLFSAECNYLNARRAARYSRKACFNYSLWVTFAAKYGDKELDYLVMDEAHNLSQIVRNVAGCVIKTVDRNKWNLPMAKFRWASGEDGINEVFDYLKECYAILDKHYDMLDVQVRHGDKSRLKDFAAVDRLKRSIEQTLNSIELYPDPDMWWWKTETSKGFPTKFVVKPITAAYHADAVLGYSKADHVVFMSATLQQMGIRIEELGLGNNVLSHYVPSIWKPDQMPIDDLDVPRMGRSVTESGRRQHAEVVAEYIQQGDKNDNVLILLRSREQTYDLADRLARWNGGALQNRVWTSNERKGTNTDARTMLHHFKRGGTIAVTWRYWEGFDGMNVQTVITAKTPFLVRDEYERKREAYNSSLGRLDTGDLLAQSWGRNRRGREEHYRVNGYPGRRVAIADRSYRQVQKYLPDYIRDAIVRH